MTLNAQGAVISRLRLRGAPVDPLAARLRLSRVLSAADLEPAGLPGTAIVFIRTLCDPLPGRLGLARNSHTPPLAWQRAVGERIDALARAAARPAHSFVPESAEAVWFADRSELLACLARDWCEGAIAARWWWRALLRDSEAARAVLAEWLRSPEYAPAALQQLAASRQAVSFVQRLDETSVSILLERVIERFGLAHLRPLLLQNGQATGRFGDGSRGVRESAPWLPWVPETVQTGLARGQMNLLAVALLLHRSPGVARSAMLAKALQRWMAPAALDAPTRKPSEVTRTTAGVMHDSIYPATERGGPPPSASIATGDRELTTHDRGPADVDRERGDGRVPASETSAPVQSANAPGSGVPQTARPGERTPSESAGEAEATGLVSAIDAPPDVSDARWVETAFGGALYLVNLGLFLDLYSDFGQPAKPGIDLPIWDFVALLGETLAGPAIRDDPLWPLLAELAGREPAEEPGLHFRPPPEWRMPESWLTPFAAADAWNWSGHQRHVQIRHPAGFVVLDVAAPERNYIDVLTAALAPYRTAGRCAGITRRAPPARARGVRRSPIRSRALKRWCSWLLPYVHARLQAALNVPAAEVGMLLCACPARLRVTATHLDAHFALAELPIEVRLCGLDRDPGWVPAAGRFIHFHFD